eukprot:scaffold28947_cov109-Isochrysis_galbana.AAC.1
MARDKLLSTVFWPRRLRFFEWIHPSTDQEVLDGFVPPVASRRYSPTPPPGTEMAAGCDNT